MSSSQDYEPLLEVSVDGAWLAEAALYGNAGAIEISKRGGTTPSHELFIEIKEVIRRMVGNGRDWEYFPVNICIHPRPGNFVYSATELDTMLKAVKHFKKERLVKGFTVAALTATGDLDIRTMAKLREAIHPKQICFSGRALGSVEERKLESILDGLDDIRGITHIRSKEIVSLAAPQSPYNDHALPLVSRTNIISEKYSCSPPWKITRSLSSDFLTANFLDNHPYIFFLLHHYSRNAGEDSGMSFLGHRLFLNACPTWKYLYDARGPEAAKHAAQQSILQIHSATFKAWDDYSRNRRSIYSGQTLQRLIDKYAYEQGLDIAFIAELYALDI